MSFFKKNTFYQNYNFLQICSSIEGEKQVKLVTERANACNKKIVWIFSIMTLAVWIAVIWGEFPSKWRFQPSDKQRGVALAQRRVRLFGRGMAANRVAIEESAHFAEYSLLGIFIASWMRCWRLSRILPLGLYVGVPPADELLLQRYVDGRLGEMNDVWLDWAGAACGVLMWLAVRQIFRYRKNALEK